MSAGRRLRREKARERMVSHYAPGAYNHKFRDDMRALRKKQKKRNKMRKEIDGTR